MLVEAARRHEGQIFRRSGRSSAAVQDRWGSARSSHIHAIQKQQVSWMEEAFCFTGGLDGGPEAGLGALHLRPCQHRQEAGACHGGGDEPHDQHRPGDRPPRQRLDSDFRAMERGFEELKSVQKVDETRGNV